MCLCDTQIQPQLGLLAHFSTIFLRNHVGAYYILAILYIEEYI